MGPMVLSSSGEAALRPGQEFAECAKGCPTMVVVPAGIFIMGSPETEAGRSSGEGPQNEVTIGKAFAVAKTEVTFDEWDTCIAAGACPRADDSSWGRGNQPLINVSWGDGKLYVAWLSRITGKEYRFLSEAEWEYAARAGSRSRWPFGDDEAMLEKHAWYKSNSNGRPHPVGKKEANAFGLKDMLGNVFEWVEDCFDEYANLASERRRPGHARTSGDCSQRMARGGSWYWGIERVRSAHRGRGTTAYRDAGLGLRVARTLDP